MRRQNVRKKRLWRNRILYTLETAVIVTFFLAVRKWSFVTEKATIKEMIAATAASANHSAWIMNGTLQIAGAEYEEQSRIDTWNRLVQISIADDHIVVLDQNGVAHATGQNGNLQCEIDGLEAVRYIEAGMNCSIAVMEDGTVQIFGILENEMRQEILQETGVCQIDVGDEHIAVLHEDGSVTAYGQNESGQCDVQTWEKVEQIAVGRSFTVGLTQKGNVVFAGENDLIREECENWKKIKMLAAGNSHVAGIDQDGQAYAAGRDQQGECQVSEWSNMASVSAGYDHTIGIDQEGHVFAVGFNGNGQCDV